MYIMKKLIITIACVAVVQVLSAQNLVDIYKKGTVKLVPDTEYAQNNNWDQVFSTYYDTIYGAPMGNRKSIVFMPDGSVVVNNAYRNFYTLFGPDGHFEKEFGIYNGDGKQFKTTENIAGIINSNFITELDDMGKMTCFDFEGNYVKTLTLDYIDRKIIPLADNKVAVVGWAIWKTRFRDFVAIVDYNTNEQQIVWEHFTDRCEEDNHCKLFNYSYQFEKAGGVYFSTMPYTKNTGLSAPPMIEFVHHQLVVAIPSTGEILIFNLEGNLLSKDKIEWATNYISVDEQKEIQKNSIERYKSIKEPTFVSGASPAENKKAQESLIKQMEEDLARIKEPIPVPVFSTILKDSDDNLLFFGIPKEEGANKFNVWIYQDNGKFVCQSSFECDEYDLSITPSKLVFRNGYVYGLQTLKQAEGNPLRLVRFKLQ
jgi:hypothetical protein